ncbi:Fn3 domain-containing protein [Haloactinopolyspora alba]|uniref:Fn3 domain-containing protein n=1 Tax=Haloactinopolyspora alba TaxID=648780 RepID=A0A2P8E9H9_9ACTN|nr:S8 family serine peptidase [Haloactinopolyspora alba]PSL06133.1 Fn3 domain-containing protein [Haloactinopolyspora alba]
MTRPSHAPGRAAGTRRAGLGVAASVALTVAAITPLSAASAGPGAHPDDAGYLGSASELTGAPPASDELVHEPSGAWFVQLAGTPSAEGGDAAELRRQRHRFLDEAAALGTDLKVRYSYDRLWHGMSVRASKADIAAIEDSARVEAVFPVATVDALEPTDTEPAMDSALGMTGADIAQSELGLDGDGLRVGIIDTGIDIDHPDLGGSGADDATEFPTRRVVAGHDFVGDDYNADPSSPAYEPDPQPDPNPDDCQGHGTHVAGIVGADGDTASGGVRGVAPAVEFGAYRVFGCGGSTTSDIILAALEQALVDDMDVVNMSLGAGFVSSPDYPTAVASDALVEQGVTVVASIGNNGTAGTWSAGAPGVGDDVIGVASFDNTEYDARMFTVSPDGREVGYGHASGSPEPPVEGSLPMARTGTPDTPDDGCDSAGELPDLSGTVALVQRGECYFYDKAINAQNAGAEAVILYNNVPGSFAPTVAPPTPDDPPVTVPVVAISQQDGLELNSRIAAGETTLTWTDETTTVENATAGLISSYSSYGMSSDLTLKPDLGAPGGLIRSTYPLEKDGYGVLSGTSMAAPHVAGAVALLLQARPDLEAGEVRDVLQNHADPADWSLVPDSGYIEPTHRQGAGMLDIDDAALAETSVTPGKLSLGESETGPSTRTLTVRNDGDTAVTYEPSHVNAISTGDAPNDPGFYLGEAGVEFGTDTLTVPAGETAELDVTVTAPDGPELGQYGGYVVLTPEDGDPLRVPFAGFVGDYQDLPVLTEAGAGLPELGRVAECERYVELNCTMGGVYDLLPDGATYTMTEGDRPVVLAHLEHPAENVSFELFRARHDGTPGVPVVGPFNTVLSVDEVGRSGTPTAFNAYVWDGTRPRGHGTDRTVPVPDGRYVLRMTVTKSLGDPHNPEHVETWVSPVITVDREG